MGTQPSGAPTHNPHGHGQHVNDTPTAQITELLHRYARLLDAGDFAGVAAMFTEAAILVNGQVIGTGTDFVESMLTDSIIVYADGTPRTRHVITHPAIDLAATDRATADSQYTVLQASPTGENVVMVGRHHDTLALRHGIWNFTTRDYGDITYTSDTSHHLRY
ncbi:nuclear transport factor 2 family protein [Gordonia polyisoprenivorans]|nr:nuclear transport factor 2 family protein [Gordonia polyisoprenivorans]